MIAWDHRVKVMVTKNRFFLSMLDLVFGVNLGLQTGCTDSFYQGEGWGCF